MQLRREEHMVAQLVDVLAWVGVRVGLGLGLALGVGRGSGLELGAGSGGPHPNPDPNPNPHPNPSPNIVGVRTNLGRLARERPAQLVGGDGRRAAGGDAVRVVELVPA